MVNFGWWNWQSYLVSSWLFLHTVVVKLYWQLRFGKSNFLSLRLSLICILNSLFSSLVVSLFLGMEKKLSNISRLYQVCLISKILQMGVRIFFKHKSQYTHLTMLDNLLKLPVWSLTPYSGRLESEGHSLSSLACPCTGLNCQNVKLYWEVCGIFSV